MFVSDVIDFQFVGKVELYFLSAGEYFELGENTYLTSAACNESRMHGKYFSKRFGG